MIIVFSNNKNINISLCYISKMCYFNTCKESDIKNIEL
jgi:hypothetical protein